MSNIIEIDPVVLATRPIPAVNGQDDKNDRGKLLVIAGGAGVPGAALLVSHAALRVGAGRLQIASTTAAALALGVAMPEARIYQAPATAAGEIAAPSAEMLHDAIASSDAVVLGPGMLDEEEAGALAVRVLASTAPAMVLDAAALTGLRFHTGAKGDGSRVVMTPHAGELAALMGCDADAIAAAPETCARDAAQRFGAVVALKGATTYIAQPDGPLYRLAGNCPGLGVSGSGDVLAGVIGGLLARGADALNAALWGVSIHARAGVALSQRVGVVGFLAREIADACAPALHALEADSSSGG